MFFQGKNASGYVYWSLLIFTQVGEYWVLGGSASSSLAGHGGGVRSGCFPRDRENSKERGIPHRSLEDVHVYDNGEDWAKIQIQTRIPPSE